MIETATFGALSPNDPSQVPMKFGTREDAERHASNMNKMIATYPGGLWNVEHWKTTPEKWVVFELK